MIRAGRAAIRQSAQKPKAYQVASYPAPVRGVVVNEPLASPQPGSCIRLDNGFPTQTTIRVRGGSTRHATVGNRVLTSLTGTVAINESVNITGTTTDFDEELAPGDAILIDGEYYVVDEVTSATAMKVTLATHDTASGLSASLVTFEAAPVQSLFSYRSGTTETFFGSTQNNVFDLTAPSPLVTPMPDISGQTDGYYSPIAFTTSGGNFLYILNGVDEAQLYDGSAWMAINGSSTPVITGIDTDLLSQGCVYRNRLFFVQKNSMKVWYPAVGSLGGALSEITMQGIFRDGGSVLFVASWSMDSGDGIDDKFVVVSTEGEVAVFEGSNPSGTEISEWNLVGVYESAKPLGKNAWLRVGGDLLILTEVGVIPISAIIQKDPAALSMAAVTRNIEPIWREQAKRRTLPWEMVKSASENMGLVNFPVSTTSDEAYCYVVNLETGAWARYTGWDTRCLHVFNSLPYFGTNAGEVMLGENGGTDDGLPYEIIIAGSFDPMGAMGSHKVVHQGRATYLAGTPFTPRLGASVDYNLNLPAAPNSPEYSVGDGWDVGLWDVALWDAGFSVATPKIITETIGRTGLAISWHIQMTIGYAPTPMVDLVSVDLIYQTLDAA